jgi:hypothetical protein
MKQEMDNQYGTLSEAVEDLKRLGYVDELRLNEAGLFRNDEQLDPALFTIDSFHRFEGPSDPGDMCIVYAIRSDARKVKGLLIGSYGAQANAIIDRMVRGLDAHHPSGKTKPVEPVRPGANVSW